MKPVPVFLFLVLPTSFMISKTDPAATPRPLFAEDFAERDLRNATETATDRSPEELVLCCLDAATVPLPSGRG